MSDIDPLLHHRVRVLHVTESMAAGVMRSMQTAAAEQTLGGMEVRLAYAERPDSPPRHVVATMFPQVRSIHVARGSSKLHRLVDLARTTTRQARADRGLIVHAHSSLAGAVVRLAGLLGGYSSRVVYSPHGFAFLRTDLSSVSKLATRFAERILSRFCAAVVAVSAQEQDIARNVGISRSVVIRNSIDTKTLPHASPCSFSSSSVVVMNSARITPQKGPKQFANIAAALPELRFVWIGEEPATDVDLRVALESAGVSVTGWLNQDDAHRLLLDCNIFLMTSAWEGMPLSLLEAQCMGIPAVAFDTVGVREIIVDGHTGYVVKDPEEARIALARLANDIDLRQEFSRNAFARRSTFDQREIGPMFSRLYSEVLD